VGSRQSSKQIYGLLLYLLSTVPVDLFLLNVEVKVQQKIEIERERGSTLLLTVVL
jgi:hypothetical protein